MQIWANFKLRQITRPHLASPKKFDIRPSFGVEKWPNIRLNLQSNICILDEYVFPHRILDKLRHTRDCEQLLYIKNFTEENGDAFLEKRPQRFPFQLCPKI